MKVVTVEWNAGDKRRFRDAYIGSVEGRLAVVKNAGGVIVGLVSMDAARCVREDVERKAGDEMTEAEGQESDCLVCKDGRGKCICRKPVEVTYHAAGEGKWAVMVGHIVSPTYEDTEATASSLKSLLKHRIERGSTVQVAGHVVSIGGVEFGVERSVARAETLANSLREALGQPVIEISERDKPWTENEGKISMIPVSGQDTGEAEEFLKRFAYLEGNGIPACGRDWCVLMARYVKWRERRTAGKEFDMPAVVRDFIRKQKEKVNRMETDGFWYDDEGLQTLLESLGWTVVASLPGVKNRVPMKSGSAI